MKTTAEKMQTVFFGIFCLSGLVLVPSMFIDMGRSNGGLANLSFSTVSIASGIVCGLALLGLGSAINHGKKGVQNE